MSIFAKFLLGSLTVGSVFFSCTPLLRASEDAQPPNAPQLLQELDSLEKQQSSAVAARLLSQANILRPALEGGSTSSKLYQEALEAVESRGRRDTGQTAADWRKKNADFLRSGQLQTAVQLHVRYLLLGLQGAGSPRNGGEWDSAGQSWAYAQELAETLQEKDLT
ncbi:MAG: hypothetical protein IAE97_08020, partial [Chthoniobacterales bacterium]|nr:hypothetical protein [Chthoniobacterales bacterium]